MSVIDKRRVYPLPLALAGGGGSAHSCWTIHEMYFFAIHIGMILLCGVLNRMKVLLTQYLQFECVGHLLKTIGVF